jgi:hypothetical protein
MAGPSGIYSIPALTNGGTNLSTQHPSRVGLIIDSTTQEHVRDHCAKEYDQDPFLSQLYRANVLHPVLLSRIHGMAL